MAEACARVTALMRLGVQREDPLIQRGLARIAALMEAGAVYTRPDSLRARRGSHDRFESALAGAVAAAAMDGTLTHHIAGPPYDTRLGAFAPPWEYLAREIKAELDTVHIVPLLRRMRARRPCAPTPFQVSFVFAFARADDGWNGPMCRALADGLLALFNAGAAAPAAYWPLEAEQSTFAWEMRRAIADDRERCAKRKARKRRRGAAAGRRRSETVARAA